MKKFKKIITVPLAIALLLVTSIPGLIPQANADTNGEIRSASIQPFTTTDFASENMRQAMTDIKVTGANYVTLIIPYYQANRQSTDMYPSWNTPTDDALITAIGYAHNAGLKVMLKPHLETDYIEWRGNINPAPSDRPAWFASYQTMLLHYGRIAQRHGVEDFCIGAELFPMTNPDYDSTNTSHWTDMIHAVRNVYGGKLTYSANRDGEYDKIQFWPLLDYIGLSAYYNLYHAQDSSPAELEKSWNAWKTGVIEPVQQHWNMPVVITEIGYRSVDGSYQAPWDWSRGGNYNEQDQANAYTALFDYWKNVPWMKGIVLWRWEIDPNAGGAGNTDYTPQHKAAVAVMKQFWTGAASNDTTPTVKPTFTTTAAITPASPVVNQDATLAVNVSNTAGAITNAIVDVEVYNNSNGQRLLQKFFDGQGFAANSNNTYNVTVNTATPATYHTEVGIFNSNWSNNYNWNSNAATFTVGSSSATTTPPSEPVPTPTPAPSDTGTTTPPTATTTPPTATTTPPTTEPTPTPTPVPPAATSTPPAATSTTPTGTPELQIIAPTDGMHVSGVIPFKALLTNRNLSNYVMSWQVDGDRLNSMYDSSDGGDHKEAMVDFTNWNWRTVGEPYNINFIAQDRVTGSTLQKAVNIYPNQ